MRRKAALRKKRLMMLAAIAALVVIVAVAVIILVTSLTVPEAKDLQIESSATTQILTWKGKPKKISYQVYRKTPATDFEQIATIPAGGEHSFVSSDLTSASLYEYKVVALKGSGEKIRESKGITASAYTLPETITDGFAQTMSKDSLTVSWTPGQPVNGYEIKYATNQDMTGETLISFKPEDIEKNEATGRDTYTIPNLVVGTTYYFSIRSFCGEDVYSQWCDPFSAVVTQAVDMTGIDLNKPMVAVTYDDGPDSGAYTDRIIAAFESAGGHATFFQLGQLAEVYPDVIQRIVNGGHEIACHTYDHEHMGEAVNEYDIVHANDAIESAGGVRPSAFRCPGGEITDTIRATCASQGQAIYHWSVDTRDWSSRDADAVMAEVESIGVSDGDIILLHNIYESSAAATERLVPWLVEKGFQLVTVDQLIQAKTGQPPVPGTQYFSASNYN